MSVQGTATLDFGAFPGKSDASVFVSQPTITGASLVEAWIFPAATADHTADEHMLETLKVFAGNVQAGSGFTIYGFNTSEISEPIRQPVHPTSVFTSSATAIGVKTAQPGNSMIDKGGIGATGGGGIGTRLYGQFNIGWVWN